jgi:uncharacterized protein
MRIYVDADAFPNAVKNVVFRAVERVGIPLVLVTCQPFRIPESEWISMEVVADGPDHADDWIAEAAAPGDLVITADIPLADRVVDRGALALDPRGTLYTAENVKERLATRDLLDELRGSDDRIGGGPPPFHKKDVHAFASQLTRLLDQRARS